MGTTHKQLKGKEDEAQTVGRIAPGTHVEDGLGPHLKTIVRISDLDPDGGNLTRHVGG